MALLAAMVWTYWIAPFLVLAVVLLLIGLGIGYLYKVTRPQYPPGKFPLPGSSRRS